MNALFLTVAIVQPAQSDYEQYAQSLRESWIQTGLLCRCEAQNWFKTRDVIECQIRGLSTRDLECCPPEEEVYRLLPMKECELRRAAYITEIAKWHNRYIWPANEEYARAVLDELRFRERLYYLMSMVHMDTWEGSRVHLQKLKEFTGEEFYYRGEW